MEQRSEQVLTGLQRVAERARKSSEEVFTSLNKYLTHDLLKESYEELEHGKAAGIDGLSLADYGEDLDANLSKLLNQAKSGRYKAPPVRRAYIPKGNGEQRGLGIPTVEDKVLQKAVGKILEAIYEEDFYECSYGFRRGRSQHQALQRVWDETMDMGGCWLLDVDIRGYFDSVDHGKLREVLSRRVRDGVLRKLVDKWLKAGVTEQGQWRRGTVGTPQGGVISPLLSNIFLHEVVDEWFEEMLKPNLYGKAFMVRYADDFVMGFSDKRDARRVMKVLGKRMDKYGLSLHPEKTKLISYCKPNHKDKKSRQGSFDFLGFTHYWGRSKKGRWVVQRKTSQKSMSKSLKQVRAWCKANMHENLTDQWLKLTAKLNGHYGYFGITQNGRSLQNYQNEVKRIWKYWLNRRSDKGKKTWDEFAGILEIFPLPPPRIVHKVS